MYKRKMTKKRGRNEWESRIGSMSTMVIDRRTQTNEIQSAREYIYYLSNKFIPTRIQLISHIFANFTTRTRAKWEGKNF